jgi:hypothetical protein
MNGNVNHTFFAKLLSEAEIASTGLNTNMVSLSRSQKDQAPVYIANILIAKSIRKDLYRSFRASSGRPSDSKFISIFLVRYSYVNSTG